MMAVDKRAQLRAVFAAWKEARRLSPELQDQLIVECNIALHARAKELFPKSKRKMPETNLTDEERAAVGAPFVDRYKAHISKVLRLRGEVDRLAKEALLVSGDFEWTLWRTVSRSSYSTQGWGAEKYARHSAEADADHARSLGVPVEVRRRERVRCGACGEVLEITTGALPPHFGCPNTKVPGVSRDAGIVDFEVWVRVAEDIDLEILKASPEPSMVEYVRLCWKRGVNPRVYCPFLPHGFEEEHGLDFQGNQREVPK